MPTIDPSLYALYNIGSILSVYIDPDQPSPECYITGENGSVSGLWSNYITYLDISAGPEGIAVMTSAATTECETYVIDITAIADQAEVDRLLDLGYTHS